MNGYIEIHHVAAIQAKWNQLSNELSEKVDSPV
jgi:hypothetical protein